MAGFQTSVGAINQTAGLTVMQLATALANADAFNTALNSAQRMGGQSGLVAAGISVSDAGLLIASFSDLANLVQIAKGAAGFLVQLPGQQAAGASNFFWNAQQLLGPQPNPLDS